MATTAKKPPAPPAPSNDSGTMTPEQEARARAQVEDAKLQTQMQDAYNAAASRSMGTFKEPVKKAKGGYVKAADGCAQRGKTRGKMV